MIPVSILVRGGEKPKGSGRQMLCGWRRIEQDRTVVGQRGEKSHD